MSNELKITISAVDKVTAVVRRVNESISKTLRPVMNVQRSLKMLGKEAGIDRMGRSLVQVARAASDVAGKIGSVLAPLTAVVGIGSIAAVGALAKKWGDFGSEVLRSATAIGMSATGLQAYRGAAALAGVDAQAFTGNMKTLGDTLEDAFYGRNQPAMALLNHLGIAMKKSADGAVDAEAAFGDLADRISRLKSPQQQALVARMFGVEESLPLLRKGRAGVAELTAQIQRQQLVMNGAALQAADQFRQRMVMMDLSLEKVRNTIGAALLPVLQPLIERFGKWAAANQDLIASRVAEFVGGFTRALDSIDWDSVVEGVKSFVDGVREAVAFLGSWKNALIIVGAVMAGPLLASIVSLGIALLSVGGGAARILVTGLGLVGAAVPALMMKLALLTSTALPGLSKAFLAVGASMETGLLSKIFNLKNAGMVAAAAAAGYALGTALYKGVIENTKLGDWLGKKLTQIAAFFGNKDAQEALDIEERAKAAQRAAVGKVGGLQAPAIPGPTPATAGARPTARSGVLPMLPVPGGGPARPGGVSQGLLDLVRRLERSGDQAVSPAGAIGRYQIMPDTARLYGFDPRRLTDPRINETVATVVLADLQKRYGNDLQAILAAYNAGPKRADRFLAAGRSIAVLPAETQKYLARAQELQAGPPMPTPYSTPEQIAAINRERVAAGHQPIGERQPTPAPLTSGRPPASAQSGPAASPTMVDAGTVTVLIDFQNMPAGVRSRAEAKGRVTTQTRIAYAMPEAGVA